MNQYANEHEVFEIWEKGEKAVEIKATRNLFQEWIVTLTSFGPKGQSPREEHTFCPTYTDVLRTLEELRHKHVINGFLTKRLPESVKMLQETRPSENRSAV